MAAVLAILASLGQAGAFSPDAGLVNPRGWPQLARFLGAALRPELDPAFLALTLHAAGQTLAFAVLGTLLSLILGSLFGLLSSEAWWRAVLPLRRQSRAFLGQAWWWPWTAVRSALALPRAIHEVIWGLLLINVLGLDPLTAVLAIGIPYGAIVAKVYAEILDETPRAALRALTAAGSPPPAAVAYALLPQALPDLVGYAFYRFECAIRAAAVLGMVGAGGLGYQLLLSTRSLKFGEMWTLIYALALLGGLADLWSGRVRRRLAPGRATRIDDGCGCFVDGRGQLQAVAPRRDRFVTGSIAFAAALLPVSWWLVGLAPGRLLEPKALARLSALAAESWPPRLPPGGLAELARLSAQTLSMSVLAMALAASLGLLLAFPAAAGWTGRRRRIGDPIAWGLTRALLLLIRAVPPPIWALVAIWVFFPGTLPGALALAAYTTGILGRLMAEVLENADLRPARALAALGARGPALVAYAVLPPTLPRYASYVLYRWEVCIRTTVVVGLVGAGGLGQIMRQQIAGFDYHALGSTLACFVVLTALVDALSAGLRRTLR
ncbi:MAG: ABC transporter permease subunit [Chloroflexi bacterium]|nr:ABC transporter permease subunit [Chloroflexota bacterium]